MTGTRPSTTYPRGRLGVQYARLELVERKRRSASVREVRNTHFCSRRRYNENKATFLAFRDLPPQAWSLPVPGALPLVLAVLGHVLRALQLMIAAPPPGRGETARQLA